MPKEARNPLSRDEFAQILTQKLEKVLIERQIQEREAINLSHSIDVSCSHNHYYWIKEHILMGAQVKEGMQLINIVFICHNRCCIGLCFTYNQLIWL
jgi:hypothetical protein